MSFEKFEQSESREGVGRGRKIYLYTNTLASSEFEEKKKINLEKVQILEIKWK